LSPPSPNPSTVVIRAPSTSAANTRHELTLRPSRITVHAPHSPSTQHFFAPVSSSSSRSSSRRYFPGGASTTRSSPLTLTLILVIAWPGLVGERWPTPDGRVREPWPCGIRGSLSDRRWDCTLLPRARRPLRTGRRKGGCPS